MENNHDSDWRESIWSVPRPFVFAYFALLTLLGLPTVIVIIWEKAPAVDARWWEWPAEIVRAAAPECGQIGIGIAFFALVTVQGVAILMVLYNAAINLLVKPIIEKHRDQGRQEGHAEANQQWEAWLQRKTEAESNGLPFDEPPPGAAQ